MPLLEILHCGFMIVMASNTILKRSVGSIERPFALKIISSFSASTCGLFVKVSTGAAVIYGYLLVLPLILWIIFKWRDVPISLMQIWCIYGYSLFVFVPVAVSSIYPFTGFSRLVCVYVCWLCVWESEMLDERCMVSQWLCSLGAISCSKCYQTQSLSHILPSLSLSLSLSLSWITN